MPNTTKHHILIAGGTGLIGSRLTQLLTANGHKVSYLSRKPGNYHGITAYKWDPAKGMMDSKALDTVTHIVSLAGESIANGRWTKEFKEKVITSRLQAAKTIRNALLNNDHEVEAIVAASAIGFYGSEKNKIFDEDDNVGVGFLSETTKQWEDAYNDMPIRTTLLRIGIVLDKDGGALPQMAMPVSFGIAPIIGSGKQMMSWIHLNDLCTIFTSALFDDKYHGKINAVASNPVSHKEFMQTLKKVVCPYALTIPTPAALIRLILGEKSALVLDDTHVINKKLLNLGFEFEFSTLQIALKNIYGK
jgi:uncharacterized protein (TIGR01777 family)